MPRVKIHDPAKLVISYHRGDTTTEIAERFGVNPSTVLYWLRKGGIEIGSGNYHRAKRKPLPPLDRRQVRNMYEAGMSTMEIGRQLGMKRFRIYDELKRQGITLLNPGNPRKLPSTEKMRQLYVEQQLTSVQIAKMFNTSASNVIRRLHVSGISTHPRGRKRDSSKCRVLVDGKPCGEPTVKIKHPTNGSIFGTMCAKHRKAHYNRLNKWLRRKNRNIPPARWLQKDYEQSPEAKVLAELMNQAALLADPNALVKRVKGSGR